MGEPWATRLPLVVSQAEAWRELLGCPATMNLNRWEKRGTWVTPDYIPPVGGTEAFKAMTGELHGKGHWVMVLLSGLRWTLRKLARPEMGMPEEIDQTGEFERCGEASALCGPDGKPRRLGDPTPEKSVGVGHYAEICPATPLARKMLLDSVLECQRLGIDCVQVDQIVGGGQIVNDGLAPCYSSEHGHLPGGGT